MQTWVEQIDALTSEQRSDLYSYLWGCDPVDKYHEEKRKHLILHGKKKHLFKIIDKDAFKTMRRLYRHQAKDIDTTIYPIEQLLEVGIARELQRDDGNVSYTLHPQALPFVEAIYHARHFDDFLKTWQVRDQLLMGILHTYAMIEVKQLCTLLETFHFPVQEVEIKQIVTWRLPIRKQLQLCNIQNGHQVITCIALKQCNVDALSKNMKKNKEVVCLSHTYEELLRRKDRYFALENHEVQSFIQFLETRFSHFFARMSAKEMIDVYQYQYGTCNHYNMILRVMDKEKVDFVMKQAIASLIPVVIKES